MTSDAELARAAAMLNRVFDHDPPLDVAALRWSYDESPFGAAAVGRVEDDGSRLGNYALAPLRFGDGAGRRLTLGVGIDLAVDPDARGSGTFRRTVEDSYERGRAAGFDGILGIANANSAPRMVSALGWRGLDPLPATLLRPGRRRRRFETLEATGPEAAARLDAISARGFAPPVGSGSAPLWDVESLRWRVRRPGHRYWFHFGDDHLVVSAVTKVSGLRFAVVLKVLGLDGAAEPLGNGEVAALMRSAHRTPLAIHWGRSPWFRPRGVRLPESRMPSPLSLVLHSLDDGFDQDSFELSALEFLDFDAY